MNVAVSISNTEYTYVNERETPVTMKLQREKAVKVVEFQYRWSARLRWFECMQMRDSLYIAQRLLNMAGGKDKDHREDSWIQ